MTEHRLTLDQYRSAPQGSWVRMIVRPRTGDVLTAEHIGRPSLQ